MTNLQIALVRYREKYRLNQTQLAEKIGCTRNALANWETGRTTPKAEMYKLIAEKLNCSTAYLLGESDDPNPTSPIESSTPTPTTAKEQLSKHKIALYNQIDEISDEQAEDILQFIDFIKSKEQK